MGKKKKKGARLGMNGVGRRVLQGFESNGAASGSAQQGASSTRSAEVMGHAEEATVI
jgi:hypothetical protein